MEGERGRKRLGRKKRTLKEWKIRYGKERRVKTSLGSWQSRTYGEENQLQVFN